jgi:hypothetical protein
MSNFPTLRRRLIVRTTRYAPVAQASEHYFWLCALFCNPRIPTTPIDQGKVPWESPVGAS